MKRVESSWAIVGFVGVLLTFNALGQPSVCSLNADGQLMQYRVTIPSGYDKARPYPVLFVPGFEKEADAYSVYLGDAPDEHGWIIVESIMHMQSDSLAYALLKYIRTVYLVDRLYISGFSANSVAISRLGAKYVEVIDGIVGMPGYANGINLEVIARNPDLHIVLIVGEKDNYWKSKSVTAHKKLVAMGVNASLDIIKDAGHIMDDFVGAPFFALMDKRAFGKDKSK